MKIKRAKVFWTGRSQAVRLPKEFRVSGDSVKIRRQGKKIILEPETTPADEWPEGYFESFQGIPDDFVAPPDPPSAPIEPLD